MPTTDPVTESVVLGLAESGSVTGQKRTDAHRAALDAVEKSDLDGMFAAYREAVESRAKTEHFLVQSLGMTERRESQKPPKSQEASPVEAIRDVALAAIGLAEKVALGVCSRKQADEPQKP